MCCVGATPQGASHGSEEESKPDCQRTTRKHYAGWEKQPQEQPEQSLAQEATQEAVVTRSTTWSERTVSGEGKECPHGVTQQQDDLRSDDAELEHLLPDQISVLWTSHQRSSASIGKTREELKGIRVALGSQLFALKSVYAQPGRNGRWSAFLKTIAMPVATANRYVSKHAPTLEGPTVNLLSEQIQDRIPLKSLRW